MVVWSLSSPLFGLRWMLWLERSLFLHDLQPTLAQGLGGVVCSKGRGLVS